MIEILARLALVLSFAPWLTIAVVAPFDLRGNTVWVVTAVAALVVWFGSPRLARWLTRE